MVQLTDYQRALTALGREGFSFSRRSSGREKLSAVDRAIMSHAPLQLLRNPLRSGRSGDLKKRYLMVRNNPTGEPVSDFRDHITGRSYMEDRERERES